MSHSDRTNSHSGIVAERFSKLLSDLASIPLLPNEPVADRIVADAKWFIEVHADSKPEMVDALLDSLSVVDDARRYRMLFRDDMHFDEFFDHEAVPKDEFKTSWHEARSRPPVLN